MSNQNLITKPLNSSVTKSSSVKAALLALSFVLLSSPFAPHAYAGVKNINSNTILEANELLANINAGIDVCEDIEKLKEREAALKNELDAIQSANKELEELVNEGGLPQAAIDSLKKSIAFNNHVITIINIKLEAIEAAIRACEENNKK